MSLIDEALKRAQAAHQEGKESDRARRPWTPAPLPDRGRVRRARRVRVAAVCLVAAAFALAGAFLFPLRTRWARATLPRSPKASAAATPALPPITSEVIVPPPPGGLPSSAHKSQPAPSMRLSPVSAAVPERRSSVPSGVAGPAPSPAAAARASSQPDARTQARETKPPLAESRTYAGEMPLAGGGKISLDGIAYSDTSPVAVVNGKVVGPGGYVEGFTIVRILPDRVELEREGSRAFLTLR